MQNLEDHQLTSPHGYVEPHTDGDEVNTERQKSEYSIRESLLWILSCKSKQPKEFLFFIRQLQDRLREAGCIGAVAWEALPDESLARLAHSLKWQRDQVSFSKLPITHRAKNSIPELLTEIFAHSGLNEHAEIHLPANHLLWNEIAELEKTQPNEAQAVRAVLQMLLSVNQKTPEFPNFELASLSNAEVIPRSLGVTPLTKAIAAELHNCDLLTSTMAYLYHLQGNGLIGGCRNIIEVIGRDAVSHLYIRCIRQLLILARQDSSKIDNRLIELGVHRDFQAAVAAYSDPEDAKTLATRRAILAEVLASTQKTH